MPESHPTLGVKGMESVIEELLKSSELGQSVAAETILYELRQAANAHRRARRAGLSDAAFLESLITAATRQGARSTGPEPAGAEAP